MYTVAHNKQNLLISFNFLGLTYCLNFSKNSVSETSSEMFWHRTCFLYILETTKKMDKIQETESR
jgi:hypothetical protein